MADYPSPATTDGLRRQSHSRASHSGTPQRAKAVTKCKTCVSCRLRKSKCDGARPRCGYCTTLDRDCSYPQDARRLNRPTRADIQILEANIESLWKFIEEHNVSTMGYTRNTPIQVPESSILDEQPSATMTYPTRMSSGENTVTTPPLSQQIVSPGPRNDDTCSPDGSQPTPQSPGMMIQSPFDGHHSPDSTCTLSRFPGPSAADLPADKDAGPSPSEVRVAGAVRQDGDIEVHGVSSMFHRQNQNNGEMNGSKFSSNAERQTQNEISQARLVAYASIQQQRESFLLRNLSTNQNIDFDGVNPELALHLIDLHFNRQHYTFMISYKPAIIDSLITNGPYCNKILLNAIYLSSSIYSERVELRTNPNDPQSAGEQFYRRLKALLVDHIDTPSIPTAVGLLLCGAILVSTGRVSAGWVHSGISYRMIIDLGCHLTIESRRMGLTSEMALLTDIELEIRKRLYWGAFLTDATQSLYFGRPPCLRSSQARVSQRLLDTYEELEPWSPYIDPFSPSPNATIAAYVPRPAFAVSTFNAIVTLLEISSRIVHAFYTMQSLQYSPRHIRELKAATELELEHWFTSLPSHLKFDPEKEPTPPPHQISLLTTYHTIKILLLRPCLSNGHLSKHFNEEECLAGERASVDAALAIWRLVASYKATFTLRRAPYLISYSVYSAIVAVLNQKLVQRSHFTDCMSFFWAALIDLQRGCNFGLQKPMEILRDMMNQFGEEISRPAESQHQNGTADGTADRTRDIFNDIYREFCLENPGNQKSSGEAQVWDPSSMICPNIGSDFEQIMDWPVNDALYGLFTPDL